MHDKKRKHFSQIDLLHVFIGGFDKTQIISSSHITLVLFFSLMIEYKVYIIFRSISMSIVRFDSKFSSLCIFICIGVVELIQRNYVFDICIVVSMIYVIDLDELEDWVLLYLHNLVVICQKDTFCFALVDNNLFIRNKLWLIQVLCNWRVKINLSFFCFGIKLNKISKYYVGEARFD